MPYYGIRHHVHYRWRVYVLYSMMLYTAYAVYRRAFYLSGHERVSSF